MGQRVANLLPKVVACLVLAAPLSPATAQNVNPFTFNFTPLPNGERYTYRHIFCGIEGQMNHNCNSENPYTGVDQRPYYTYANMGNDYDTRFAQEMVMINGVEYYHVIVGDPASGFGQEIYMATSPYAQPNNSSPGERFSDSGGASCFPGPFTEFAISEKCLMANSGADPLRHDALFTGNGTGNASKMVMKQVVRSLDGSFNQEFLKDKLSQKPVIKQTNVDADINANFVMDMSNSNYSTDSIAGVMTNTLDITVLGMPEGVGDFVFTPSAGSNITAGRYKANRKVINNYELWPGGWTMKNMYSEYVYFDGGIDPVLNVNWAAFRDPAQNPHPLTD